MSQNFVDSSKIGIAIMSGFSVVWAAAVFGLSSLPSFISLLLLVATLSFSVAMIYLASRRRFEVGNTLKSTTRSPDRTRVFIVTNFVQAVLFSVVISVCIATSNIELIPLYGALIVGAHFIPLAFVFAATNFFVIGAIMSLTGVAALGLHYIELVDAASLVAVVGIVSITSLLGTSAYELRTYSAKPGK